MECLQVGLKGIRKSARTPSANVQAQRTITFSFDLQVLPFFDIIKGPFHLVISFISQPIVG